MEVADMTEKHRLAQKKYRESHRDKYNDYMRKYYQERVLDDTYRLKRNEYRRKAYQKKKSEAKNVTKNELMIMKMKNE